MCVHVREHVEGSLCCSFSFLDVVGSVFVTEAWCIVRLPTLYMYSYNCLYGCGYANVSLVCIGLCTLWFSVST